MKDLRAHLALLVAIGLPTKVVAQLTCTAAGSPDICSIAGQIVFTAIGLLSLQTSSATTVLRSPTPADYNAGFNTTVGPTLTVRANQSWTVHIRSAAPLWTATNTSGNVAARPTKPAADLRWSTASNGVFTPTSTTDVTVVNGLASDGTIVTLHFRTVYNWSLDTPGNYSLALMLTLTSP